MKLLSLSSVEDLLHCVFYCNFAFLSSPKHSRSNLSGNIPLFACLVLFYCWPVFVRHYVLVPTPCRYSTRGRDAENPRATPVVRFIVLYFVRFQSPMELFVPLEGPVRWCSSLVSIARKASGRLTMTILVTWVKTRCATTLFPSLSFLLSSRSRFFSSRVR